MKPIWTAERAEKILAALRIEQVEDAWKPGLPGELVNDRGDRQVVRIQIQEWDRTIYLKRWRFPPGSPARLLPGKSALRGRGGSEFKNLKELASLGIRVPTPLFFGEETGLFGPVASILALEDLAGYVCSLDWGKEHPDHLAAIGHGVGAVMGTLHAAGVFHRSPGLKHFYLDPLNPEAPFALLDVPRLDRIDPQLSNTGLRNRLGMESPSPERDLSKTILAIRGSFPGAMSLEPAFWEGYLSVVGRASEAEELKNTVEEWARSRREGREKRAARKE